MGVTRIMRQGKLTRRTLRPQQAWAGRGSWAAGIVVCASLAIGGCAPEITTHGHVFYDSDIAQLQPGMSQDQVRMVMGTPTTTTTSGTGNVYYYISSTTAQTSFLLPKETDRKVAAVYFDGNGGIERVANYGLKDGKIFDYISATTPAPGGKDDGLLKQLFRNLGQKQIFGE